MPRSGTAQTLHCPLVLAPGSRDPCNKAREIPAPEGRAFMSHADETDLAHEPRQDMTRPHALGLCEWGSEAGCKILDAFSERRAENFCRERVHGSLAMVA